MKACAVILIFTTMLMNWYVFDFVWRLKHNPPLIIFPPEFEDEENEE